MPFPAQQTNRNTGGHGERARFWRAGELGKVDLLRAEASRHAYARHAHDGFALGVVEAGAHGFVARGASWLALPRRSVIVVNPGDVHDGHGVGGSYSYRMLYLDPGLMAEAAGAAARPPFFPAGVVEDRDLATQIRRLHRELEAPTAAGRLARESRFLALLSRLASRHGRELPAGGRHATPSRGAAERARDFLAAHVAEDLPLAMVAAAAGVSRYHLVRQFHRAFGLPPHAWLMQHRLRLAQRRLGAGEPPAAVAAALGFVDQSHLTRRFNAAFGVTPGRYRRASNPVQAARPDSL
jgi:AraC-like DNA-binding protein